MPELKARPKIVARGISAFTLVTLGVNIDIGRAMPNTNYKVYFRQLTGAALSVPSVSNVTATGFRASVGVGVAATFEWVIVED